MLSDLEIDISLVHPLSKKACTSLSDKRFAAKKQEEIKNARCHREVLPGGCLITLVHVPGDAAEHFLHVVFSHEIKKVNQHSRVQTSWRPC